MAAQWPRETHKRILFGPHSVWGALICVPLGGGASAPQVRHSPRQSLSPHACVRFTHFHHLPGPWSHLSFQQALLYMLPGEPHPLAPLRLPPGTPAPSLHPNHRGPTSLPAGVHLQGSRAGIINSNACRRQAGHTNE